MKKLLIICVCFITNLCYSQTPTTPTNFSGVEITPGVINFNWTDNSNDEEGFRLEEKLVLFKKLNEINSNVETLTYNYELENADLNAPVILYEKLKTMQNDKYQKTMFAISSFKTRSDGTKIYSSRCTTIVNKTRWDLNLDEVKLSSSSIAAGSTISIQSKISNVSNFKSNRSKIYYMLSKKPDDASDDASGVIICCKNIPAIDPGNSYNHEVSYTLPTKYIGKYYVNVLIYSGIEPVGLNNFKNAPINILDPDPKPDLLFESYSISGNQEVITLEGETYPKFYNGDQGYFDFTILNKGTSSSEKTDFTVFISKDKELSYDDRIISSTNDYIPIILPNFSYGNCGSFWFVRAYDYITYTGVYWLLGVVDYLNNNDEKNETNNTVVIPVFISGSSSSSIINETKQDNQITSKDFGNKKFKLYPNPCTSNLNIILDNDDYESVQIIDNTGKVVLNEKVNSRTFINLNISNLNKGLYTVILLKNNNIYSEKLIIL